MPAIRNKAMTDALSIDFVPKIQLITSNPENKIETPNGNDQLAVFDSRNEMLRRNSTGPGIQVRAFSKRCGATISYIRFFCKY